MTNPIVFSQIIRKNIKSLDCRLPLRLEQSEIDWNPCFIIKKSFYLFDISFYDLFIRYLYRLFDKCGITFEFFAFIYYKIFLLYYIYSRIFIYEEDSKRKGERGTKK